MSPPVEAAPEVETPPVEAAPEVETPPIEAAPEVVSPPIEAAPVVEVVTPPPPPVELAPTAAEPPARPASSFTRPEPRPRTGASARIGAGTRPPTRTAGVRPGPLSARSERPDPASLAWKPTVPFTVDTYTLDTESDLGAHGVTFAGRDGTDAVQVLVFHPAFFSAFRRTANLERLSRARRCEHPAIAPILAVGELGATRWVATRPVGGTPLTHWRRDYGAMPLSETLRVVAQLAAAIEAVHLVGGVHGGLSPETIRFYPGSDVETGARADRVVVVHPFWLDAADVPPAELRSPRTAWLAPELVFGEVADSAADIYGIGLVLGYLLACGMTEPGHSLLVQGIDVPPGLDDVYVIATSRQPEHRFESIAALREALEAAAGDEWLEALERSQHVTAAATPITARAEVLEVEDADLLEPGAETTDEDQAVPTFPAITDTDERTDTALPAFVIEEDLEDITATGVSELAYADDLRPTAAVAGVPPTGRGKRIVVPTLPHGHRSGLLPVAEVAPPLLPTDVPARDVGKPSEAPVPAMAPVSSGAPDTLVRVKAATGAASRPIVDGPPPLPPGLLQATYSSSLEVLDGPSALPPEGPPAPPFEVLDEEVAAEATLVEPVAPALLAASADILFAAPAPPELEEVIEPLPGASLASLIPPPPIDGPVVGSGPTSGLLAAPLTATAVSASRAAATGRGPRIESLPSGPLMPLSAPASSAPLGLEPRTLRDPSGMLAGAQVVHSGKSAPIVSAGPTMAGPTLADLHRAPLSAHIARPVEKRRGWMVWAVLAALLVGGVIAFVAFGSDSDKPDGVAVAPAPPATTNPPVTAPSEPDTSIADADEADVALAAVGDTGPTVEDTAVAAVDTIAPDTAVEDTAVAAVDTIAPDTTVEDTAVAAVDTITPDTTVEDTAVAAVDAVAETTVAHVEMPEIITDPDKLKCPDGMLRMKRKVKVDAPTGEKLDSWDVTCIDRFEYPGGGASPAVGLDLPAARAACTSRGKRLCTRAEWRRACGGNYPYGKDYDPERCNTAGTDGTPKPILAAGAKKGCMSPSGAFDMVGNVAEWTSDGFINGGTSLRNSDDATCGSASRRAGGAPHVGFRCCADAK